MAYFKRVNGIGGVNWVIESDTCNDPKAIEITKEEYEEIKREMMFVDDED